ncbi:MAG: prolyl oligopeptidase family serine peptidase [Pseudomonadota bacterium]
MTNDTAQFLELERDEAAIEAFVATENARTEAALCDDAYARDVETATRILESPDTLPGLARRGAWLYTFRQTAANPRGRWLRLPETERAEPDADWQVVFDLDDFCAESGEIWHWRGAATAWFDPDRVLLCLSLNGSDHCRFVEFDCKSRSMVDGGFDLGPEKGGAEWLDPDTLLWATAKGDAATSSGWAGQIRRLPRGTSPDDAPVLFEAERDDLLVRPYVVLTADRTPVACVSRYTDIGQERVTLLDGPFGRLTLPAPADTLVWNTADHYAYIVQRSGGAPGALMLGRIGETDERCIFTPEPRRSVDPYSLVFSGQWMLWIVSDELRRSVQALDLSDPEAEPVTLDLPDGAESIYVGYHDAIGPAADGTLQLRSSGFLQPSTTRLFNLKAGSDGIEWRLLREEPEAFDASGLAVRLVHAVSDDGTRIPYHLVLPDGADTGGDLPVLLYGYGGFGASVAPGYDRLNGALWLSRGGAYALAHIRGGGEFGPDWHLAAKAKGRDLAFQDFAAVASDLATRGLTRPDRIACHGASNGGLLCGVMLTRYPERFGAVWSSVGVFDMVRFHVFAAGMAWRDEYGDPDVPDEHAYLQSYSPLHNVPAAGATLPPTLIDTSSHDDRVDASHARRFAAALRASGHVPWFFEHGDGGHGGGGATTARARELALGYAFLRHALGLPAPGAQ